MNCLAREAKTAAQLDKARREYGLFLLEYIDACIGAELVNNFGFRKIRLQRFYDAERSSLMDTVSHYSADYMRVHDRQRGDRQANQNELMCDAIMTAQTQMDRELGDIGFAYNIQRLIRAVPPEGYIRDKRKLALRLDWLTRYGLPAARAYITSALLYFHNQYGWGEVRLMRLYKPVEGGAERFKELFLKSEKKYDDELRRELVAKQAVIEGAGIELIELDEGDAVVVSDKADVAVSSMVEKLGGDETVSEYDRILKSVIRDYRRSL
ncbi:MAG: hypothetical protein ACI3ZQ_06015 [Candidatus Cryptobacteroides sp.]